MGQGIEIESTPLSKDIVKEQSAKNMNKNNLEFEKRYEEVRRVANDHPKYYTNIEPIRVLISKIQELEKELIARREQVEELTKLVDQDLKHIDKLVRYIKAEDPWQEVIIASMDDNNNPFWKIIPRGELEDELEELGTPPKEVFIFANPLRIVKKKIYDIEVNSDIDKLIEEIYG